MRHLLFIGVAAFAATTVAYLAALWSPRPALVRVGHGLLAATVAVWALLLVSWGAAGERGTHLYLGFSAWALAAIYLVSLRRYPIGSLGSLVGALCTALAILAAVVVHRAVPVAGALSDWLLRSHIGLAFVGLVALSFASAMSAFYLVNARLLKRKSATGIRLRLPPLDVMDRLALRALVVGFPFYTLALLLGSAQALRLDGHGLRSAYVFAGASWIVYGAVLQARITAGWRGRRAAVLTVSGFVLTLVVVVQYSLGIA